ncbi:MAG: VOC family protein [bacterium]
MVKNNSEDPPVSPVNTTIDYIELPATDLAAQKSFYSAVFGWHFTDYGPNYTAFSKQQAGRDGGFTTESKVGQGPSVTGGVLIVLYTEELEQMTYKITKAGGVINIPIFSFPGGRRFHFRDPSGNELAVWSDK